MFTNQGVHRCILVASGLVVHHNLVSDTEELTAGAVVIHGGNRQRVVVRAGRAVGVHSHVIAIQIAASGSAICPAAGVTGRHCHNRARGLQVVQDFLIGIVRLTGETRIGRAQGQVDRICTQNHCVLDCGHIIGVIRAAARAKDFHGEDLCIRSNTLHQDGFQRIGECAVTVGYVSVGCSNAFNVRTMLTLGIRIVGDVIVLINVVVGKGDLLADVGLGRIDVDVQLILHACNLFGIQHIQRCQELRRILADHTGLIGQGVHQCICIEGLMIRIDTSIDHSHPSAGACVPGSPCRGGANHRRRGRHKGIIRLIRIHDSRLVTSLNVYGFHASDLLNGLNLAVRYIGGNNVGSQGQVPDHVQIHSGCLFNLGRHGFLVLSQICAIVHCCAVLCNAFGREACCNSRLLFQNDGDTNYVIGGVDRTLRFFPHRCPMEAGRDRAVVYPLKAELGAVRACGTCGNRKATQQRHNQQQRQQTGWQMHCLHTLSSFLSSFRW